MNSVMTTMMNAIIENVLLVVTLTFYRLFGLWESANCVTPALLNCSGDVR